MKKEKSPVLNAQFVMTETAAWFGTDVLGCACMSR